MDLPIDYLYVPYDEKDEARALGARWDPSVKKWYVPIHASKSEKNVLMKRWDPKIPRKKPDNRNFKSNFKSSGFKSNFKPSNQDSEICKKIDTLNKKIDEMGEKIDAIVNILKSRQIS
jgi:hypothetical protein